MPLTLYYHPLASYCWQPLIALYENDTAFKPHIVGRLRGAYQDGRKIIPREPEDIAYDARGILCQTNGTRMTYTETKNPANENSHCDLAYSDALAVANAEDNDSAPAAWQSMPRYDEPGNVTIHGAIARPGMPGIPRTRPGYRTPQGVFV